MSAKIIQLFDHSKDSEQERLERIDRVKRRFIQQFDVLPEKFGTIKWPYKEKEYLLWKEYSKAPVRWRNSGKPIPEYVSDRKQYYPRDRISFLKFLDHPTYWKLPENSNRFIVTIPYGTDNFDLMSEFCKDTRTVIRLLPPELSFKYVSCAVPLVMYRPEDEGMDERFGHLTLAETLIK